MASITRIPSDIVNAYIPTGDTGSILIDTGNSGAASRIIALPGHTEGSVCFLSEEGD